MPQNPIVPRPGGALSALNISAADVVKAAPGTLWRVSVTTAGSAAGAAYDASATSGNTAANLIAAIPNTVGIYYLEWPCANGILIVPGTGQVVSVSYA
ncbi:hypothetical protein KDW46_02430 [Burkholderia vietnamiensis]|nr:hypothetical protein [Burkholderia vietnamiensis]